MSKVVLIGIDGLDPILIERWIDHLPNFKKIKEKNSFLKIQSTFPPDSICAWVSIFTGQNPAEHGIIDSIDYLDAKKFYDLQIDQDAFKGKTFWDELSKKGKRVIIINPFLAYPAWKVNGIMISGPVFESGDISVYPEELKDRYVFPTIGGIVDFPRKSGLDQFANKAMENTKSLAQLSLEILSNHQWDLSFISFLTLDRVKHFFWRYHDENDPTHPMGNKFKSVIKNFYCEFDNIIGKYLKFVYDNTKLIIISDHGHRRRCTKCFSLNEYLRKKGYLITTIKRNKPSLKRTIEKLKVFILKIIDKWDLNDLAFRLVKFIPNRKILKKSSYLIDKKRSNAFTGELCSTNPYGGIELNKKLLGNTYESARKQMISELVDFNKKCNIFKWIKKREDVYSGKFLGKYPDILFELHEEYGVNWNLFCDFITVNPTHRKISGGHKNEATFLVYPQDDRDKRNVKSIIDLKDYIIRGFVDQNSSSK